MKIEIEHNEVRIKGNYHGEKRHLLIWVTEKDGLDIYKINLIRDGFQSGCLPTITISSEFIIARNNNLEKGEQIIR